MAALESPGIYSKGKEDLRSMSSFESQILWKKHSRELGVSQNLLPSPKRTQNFLSTGSCSERTRGGNTGRARPSKIAITGGKNMTKLSTAHKRITLALRTHKDLN